MARKLKAETEQVSGHIVWTGFAMAARQLFDKNIKTIEENRKRDGAERMKISFAVTVDYSESVPSIKVGLSWSQTVKDELLSVLPDEDQEQFAFMSVEEAKAQIQEQGGDDDDGSDSDGEGDQD